jgi:hypothetical protein
MTRSLHERLAPSPAAKLITEQRRAAPNAGPDCVVVRRLVAHTGTAGLAIAAGAIAFGTAIYYMLLLLALESSLGFAPAHAFANVAVYRSFHDAGIALPLVIQPGTSGNWPDCFVAGEPNPALTGNRQCQTAIYRVAFEGRNLCSVWRREICTVVGVPLELAKQPFFSNAILSYAQDPCRFVRDHDEIKTAHLRALGRSPHHEAPDAPIRNVIHADFYCGQQSLGDARANARPEFWRKVRPFIALRDARGDAIALVELTVLANTERALVSDHRE